MVSKGARGDSVTPKADVTSYVEHPKTNIYWWRVSFSRLPQRNCQGPPGTMVSFSVLFVQPEKGEETTQTQVQAEKDPESRLRPTAYLIHPAAAAVEDREEDPQEHLRLDLGDVDPGLINPSPLFWGVVPPKVMNPN